MKKIIGCIMLAVPFIAFGIDIIATNGLIAFLIISGSALTVAGLIWGGICLLIPK